MSCRDILCPDSHAAIQQSFPLYIPVAGDTRIRSASVQILFRKIVDHILFKFFSEIHDIVRNPESGSNPSCILHSAQAAASAIFLYGTCVFFLPYLHGDPNHVIALFFQKPGCHRRVYASRHPDNYSAHQYSSSSSSSPSWMSDFGFSSPSILIPFFSA